MTRPATLEGGCRCGAVRFRAAGAPLMTSVCHCAGRQRMTGSAFSTTVSMPTDGFAVMQGETVLGGARSAGIHHHHCDRCKSWLFTRVEPEPGFVNVRATMLDDAGWFVPFLENYTSEMLPWAKTPAKRSYPRFPEMDEYPALIAAYRQEG